MDELLIPENAGNVQLRLVASEREPSGTLAGLRVEMIGPSLSAATPVFVYPPLGLSHLFEDMARDWKGWSGAKEWQSLEGELKLRCTQDRLGHVSLQATLLQSAYPSAWNVEATVLTEAGQLDRLARLVRRFEGNAEPPNPALQPTPQSRRG